MARKSPAAATPALTVPESTPSDAAAVPVVATATAGEIHYYVNPTYVELPVGDDGGIMRADIGDYVVTTDAGTFVMPPSVFAEAYPDLVA